MLPRTHRLRQARAFQAVYGRGRSWADPQVVLHARPVADGSLLIGVVAGKKVGGAVQRNRVRRLIREAVRRRLATIRHGFHLVWVARAAAREATWEQVQASVDSLLTRARLLRPAAADAGTGGGSPRPAPPAEAR